MGLSGTESTSCSKAPGSTTAGRRAAWTQLLPGSGPQPASPGRRPQPGVTGMEESQVPVGGPNPLSPQGSQCCFFLEPHLSSLDPGPRVPRRTPLSIERQLCELRGSSVWWEGFEEERLGLLSQLWHLPTLWPGQLLLDLFCIL